MYFLAIVAKEDLLRGNIAPSYILCASMSNSENRSPWRVYRANTNFNCPRVLVKWPTGNEAMEDFLSHYRTRDHMHGDKRYKHSSTKKYYPEGALFWFECNEYGEADGPAIFIKNVPDKSIAQSDGGKQRLEEKLSEPPPAVNTLFSRDPWSAPLLTSHVKPRMFQYADRVCNK